MILVPAARPESRVANVSMTQSRTSTSRGFMARTSSVAIFKRIRSDGCEGHFVCVRKVKSRYTEKPGCTAV